MSIEVRKPTQEEIKLAGSWPTWSKDVSIFDWSYGQKETCLIVKGRAEVIGKNGEAAGFSAGDLVIFPEGLECTWKIFDKIEKKYKFGD